MVFLVSWISFLDALGTTADLQFSEIRVGLQCRKIHNFNFRRKTESVDWLTPTDE